MLRIVCSLITKNWINFIHTPSAIWRISSQKINTEKVELRWPANTFTSQANLRKLEAVGYAKASCRAKQLIFYWVHKQNNHSTDHALLPGVLSRYDEKGSPGHQVTAPSHPTPTLWLRSPRDTICGLYSLGFGSRPRGLCSNPSPSPFQTLPPSLCSPPPAISWQKLTVTRRGSEQPNYYSVCACFPYIYKLMVETVITNIFKWCCRIFRENALHIINIHALVFKK